MLDSFFLSREIVDELVSNKTKPKVKEIDLFDLSAEPKNFVLFFYFLGINK